VSSNDHCYKLRRGLGYSKRVQLIYGGFGTGKEQAQNWRKAHDKGEYGDGVANGKFK
jgi:hypothetical protein